MTSDDSGRTRSLFPGEAGASNAASLHTSDPAISSAPTGDETSADSAPVTRSSIDPLDPSETQAFVDRSGPDQAADPAAEFVAPPGFDQLEVLGRGGMGLVFKARHAVLGRTVAIKVPFGAAAGSDERSRFLREARSAARLRHAHICPIHEIGEVAGRPYLVMAYIAGETLEEKLSARPIEPIHAAKLTADLALAIQYAHEQGVVHRDLKPSNVMIEEGTGQPLLLDFGLAKELSSEKSDLTHTGQIMGTPCYMAPEQARGRVDLVGPKSDVYALGAILYRMLAGRRPFDGPLGEVLHRVQHEPPPLPRSFDKRVPRDLETICLKAMAKAPEERYATAGALAEDLKRFLSGEPIRAKRTPLLVRAGRYARRNPLVTALILLVAVSVGAAMFLIAALSAAGAGKLSQQAFVQSLAGVRVAGTPTSDVSSRAAAWLATANDEREREEIRRSIIKQLGEVLDLGLKQPGHTAAEFDQLAAVASLLATWSPENANEYRQKIDRQRVSWQVVYELKAPFDDWDKIFDSQYAELRADGVYTRATGGVQRLEIAAPTDRPIQVEVEYSHVDRNSPAQRLFGVMLQDAPDSCAKFGIEPDPLIGWKVHLSNKTTVLGQHRVSESAATVSPFRVVASREGRRLTLELPGRPVLSADDHFRSEETETGALSLPPGVGVSRLKVLSKLVPPWKATFPEADALVRKRDFAAASELYSRGLQSPDRDAAQEARFKVGYCLFRTKRYEEAGLTLLMLGGEIGDVWPRAARAYGAAALMLQGHFDKARPLLLGDRTSPDANLLTANIALDERREIGLECSRQFNGFDVIGGGDDKLLALLRDAVDTLPTLGVPEATRQAQQVLVRVLQFRGQYEDALKIAEAIEDPLPMNLRRQVQILRDLNRDADAVALLRALLAGPRGQEPNMRSMAFSELAGLEARQSHWAAAEEAARSALSEMAAAGFGDDPVDREDHLSCSLLLGCLAEQRGDLAAAQVAWAAGIPSQEQLPSLGASRAAAWRAAALAALSGRLDAPLLDAMAEAAFARPGQAPFVRAGYTIYTSEGSGKRFAPIVARAFQRRSARAFVRDLAFGRIKQPDWIMDGLTIPLAEMMRELAVDGRTTSKQDGVFEQAARLAVRDFGPRGAPDPIIFTQLLMAGRGVSGAFGWAGAAPRLSADLRAHFAYGFANWRLRTGNVEDARSLLKEAIAHAPVGSSVGRLASAELAALEAQEALLVVESTAAVPVELTIASASRPEERHPLAAGQTLELRLPPGEATLRIEPADAPVRLVDSLLVEGTS
ncbi:MAG TPA: serine/threonine-protein kinase, partial [Pirellulales bacterium]